MLVRKTLGKGISHHLVGAHRNELDTVSEDEFALEISQDINMKEKIPTHQIFAFSPYSMRSPVFILISC